MEAKHSRVTPSDVAANVRAAELVALAARLEADGRDGEAVQHLRLALDQPAIGLPTWQAAGMLADACGDLDLAERCWRRLGEIQPWEPRWPFRLALAAEQRADYRTARDILAAARARWPDHALVYLLRLRLGAVDEAARLSAEEAGALARNPGVAPPLALRAARKLVGLGLGERARAALTRLARLPDDDIAHAAKVELKSLDLLDQAGPAAPDPGQLDAGNPAIFHRAAGADTTLLLFSGLGGRVGVSVNVFHAIVAALGVNAVYLYDPARLLHLDGNPLLGRGYPAALAALGRMLEAWQSRRLICVGSSAGGYAALRYGMDLDAERVIGFSAPTTLTQTPDLPPDGRVRAVRNRLHRLLPEMTVDLRDRLRASAGRPGVDLYFGAAMAKDRHLAERVAGLPGVTLHPVAGVDRHDVAGALLLQDRLGPILAEACRPPAA